MELIRSSSPIAFSANAFIKFEFSFNPCHELFPYETATVAVYAITPPRGPLLNDKSNDNGNLTMDGPRKRKEINPSLAENKVYDLPCGKTFDGEDLEPIHVDKFVGLSEYKGRSIVTLVVSKISFCLLFLQLLPLVTHCCYIVLPLLNCA